MRFQKENILLLLVMVLFSGSTCCQNNSLNNKKSNFYIHVGINNSMPKEENYHFLYVNNNPDGQVIDYNVSPQYSLMGGALSFGFQYPIIKMNKAKISIGPEIGVNFYHNKIIKIGTRNGGFGGNILNFKGKIYTANNFYNSYLNIVTSLVYPLNNTFDFNFYTGIGINYNFITTSKTTEEDIILNKTSNYKSTRIGSLIYPNFFLKFELLKKIKERKYGIFVGATFLGDNLSSSYPNSTKKERDLNPIGEFTHRYFILNYGISYQF